MNWLQISGKITIRIHPWHLHFLRTLLVLYDSSWYLMGFLGGSAGKESACNAGDPGSIPRWGRPPGERTGSPLQYSQASLVAQMVKNLPAVWETQVSSLGQGRSPGEGYGNPLQSSCLENPMDRGAWWVTVHRVWPALRTQTWLSD